MSIKSPATKPQWEQINVKDLTPPNIGLKVSSGSTTFLLEIDGDPDIGGNAELNSIRNSFTQVTNDPDSAVTISDGGLVSVSGMDCNSLVRFDGLNIISFTKIDNCSLGGSLAIASFWYSVLTGSILECDVTFNTEDYQWSTNPGAGEYDIEAVSNHETMHCLGLEHSSLAGTFSNSTGLEVDGFHGGGDFTKQASMFPYAPSGSSALEMRTIELDDFTAFRTIYPTTSFNTNYGSISGKVFQSDGSTGVKGAFVVAVPVADPHNPRTGRISGLQANNAGVNNLDLGSYKITGLLPGSYCVRVEPLKGGTLGTNSFTSANTFYTSFSTSFEPEFYSGATESSNDMNIGPGDAALVTVIASQDTTNINIILNSPGIASSGDTCAFQPSGTAALFRVERQTGEVYADGAYACGLPSNCFNSGSGADLAERIHVSEAVEPGDVVEPDPQQPKLYRKARTGSSGIISTQPGMTLANHISIPRKATLTLDETSFSLMGEIWPLTLSSTIQSLLGEGALLFEARIGRLLDRAPGDTHPLLALAGRVPVKATTENGPIQPGDLLRVSLSRPGYATKCKDPKACEGSVIGKALGALEASEGVILILVTGR
jgi:hypothetical protein